MDILTTLLFFILMVMSLQKFSIIQSTSLTAGEESKDKKPVFTLQITVKSNKEILLWLGPYKGLDEKMTDVKFFNKYVKRTFVGNQKDGFSKIVKGRNFKDLLNNNQKVLVVIKKIFPSELNAVASFTDRIKYQEMIDTISSIRELGPKKEGIVRTIANVREMSKVLFPAVIIAEEGEGA